MPTAPAQGTSGTAAPVAGGPLAEGSLNLAPPSPVNAPNQALMVSSAPARAATAANVTKLQTITTPPSTTTQNPLGSTGATGAQNPTSPTKTAPSDGSATVNEATARQMLGTNFTGVTTNGDGTFTLDKGAMARANGGGTPSSTTGDNSSTPDPFAGIPGTTPKADIDAAVSKLDPSVQGIYRDQMNTQNQTITDDYNAMQSAKATLANDPALTAALSGIDAQYQVLIQQMNAANTQVLGRASTSVGAFGGLGQMNQNFIANQTSLAAQRVGSLTAKMDQAKMAMTAAYYSKDDKALNDASDAYTKAKTDTANSIKDLMAQVQTNIKDNQAQQKLDAQATKDQLAADHNTIVQNAKGLAQNIVDSGITDVATIQATVTQWATDNNVDPAAAYSAVAPEINSLNKAALTAKNTQDSMDARDANLALSTQRLADAENNAANPKKTASQIKDDFYAGLPQLDGKTSSDGTPYYHKAADGGTYLTWDGFSKLLDAAKQDGISRKTFITDNPDLFDQSDEGIKGYNLTTKEKAIIAEE